MPAQSSLIFLPTAVPLSAVVVSLTCTADPLLSNMDAADTFDKEHPIIKISTVKE